MAAKWRHKQRQAAGIQMPYIHRKLQSLPKSSPLFSLCLLLIGGSLTRALVVSMPGIREFPDSQIPSSLSDRISPLSPVMALRFLWYIKTGVLPSFGGAFCEFARLECNASVPQPVTLEENNVHLKESAEKLVNKSELFVGNQINLPDLRSNLPPRAFLPRILATSLPLTNESLPNVMQTLNVPFGSPLAHHMQRTLSVCDQTATEQAGTCVTSLEAMVEFATSGLGSSAVEILHPSRSVTSSNADRGKRMTIREIKERRGGAIGCRELMFPFLVFSCETRKYERAVMEVKLESSDGDEVKGVVECRVLCSGKEEVCRWVATDSVIWVLKEDDEMDAEPRAWVNQKFHHHHHHQSNIINIYNNVGGGTGQPNAPFQAQPNAYPTSNQNQYPMNQPFSPYSKPYHIPSSSSSMSSPSSSLNPDSSRSSSFPSSSSSDPSMLKPHDDSSSSTSNDSSGLSSSDPSLGSSKSSSLSDDSSLGSSSKSSLGSSSNSDSPSSKSSDDSSSSTGSDSSSSSDSLSNNSSSRRNSGL